MKKRISTGKVVLALMVFSPLTLIPATGRTALLPSGTCRYQANVASDEWIAAVSLVKAGLSRKHAGKILQFLSPEEVELLAGNGIRLRWGGQRSSPLDTNEKAAIVLTLVMIGLMVGFVEQSR